ncbi:hypothetical protein FPV67DRAFT_333075 [Lyophyllum atratum]|nr:hypothetical protein FPV67DRAFT_333075 [Lyophyllum atratum]
MVIIIAVLVLLGPLCGFLGALVDRMVAADPADPRARRRIRQEWDARIKKYHQEEHDLIEKREQIIKDYERRDAALFQRHERAIEDYKRQEAQLIWRREQRIDDFRREEAEWKRKIDRFEEELKEKVERERRERELARLYWVDVTGDEHCIANGRKSYTARLANLSGSINGVEACKATPITINGITYQKPITCEQARWGGSVHGRWVADNEAVCAAFWEVVNRKGCTAPNSGFRRIEAKLGGVHGGENAETLCLTTPLTINGQTYERPMACPYWGIFSGYWAVWDIPDEHCR